VAAYAITIEPDGTEQVNGGNTFASIDASNDWATFINNGTEWILLNSAIA